MNNKLISSKGYYDSEYSLKETEKMSNEKEIIELMENNNGIIFIRNGSIIPIQNIPRVQDIVYFVKNIHLLNNEIILITSDGDRPVPSSYHSLLTNTILQHKMIKKWYTQNYDKSIIHEKISYLPIGFDFHTPRDGLINDDKMNYMMNIVRENNENANKIDMILSDTHFSISNSFDRKDLFNKLKNNKNIHFIEEKKNFTDIFKLYNNYKFVLSPMGNGLDCHRTWECLLAGAIVITKSSPLDDMYIDNDLPVVIIEDWDELNENINEKMNDWYDRFKSSTTYDNIIHKLRFKYWLDK